MNDALTFQLDGQSIAFQQGDTVMDAALRADHYIPHLCHNPDFEPHGSCRVCVVKANGREVSACTFPAQAGAVVESETESIQQQRITLLQMLFVEGNHVCPACEKSGACQLQAVAYRCGMLTPHFRHFYPRRELDASHPDFVIDYNRCIVCELCVRASRDEDGKSVFALNGRGLGSHLVVNTPSGKLADSTFSKDDKAAHVCPVGAILPKHEGYATPIGARMYDLESIDDVGDVAHPKTEEPG